MLGEVLLVSKKLFKIREMVGALFFSFTHFEVLYFLTLGLFR